MTWKLAGRDSRRDTRDAIESPHGLFRGDLPIEQDNPGGKAEARPGNASCKSAARGNHRAAEPGGRVRIRRRRLPPGALRSAACMTGSSSTRATARGSPPNAEVPCAVPFTGAEIRRYDDTERSNNSLTLN
jgi:hypothetical protein